MPARKVDERTYLDVAEDSLRAYAKNNQSLSVWRGEIPNSYYGDKDEAVQMSMLDKASPDKPPALIVLSTYIDEVACIEFKNGGFCECELIPFNGGHDPIARLLESAKRFSSL